MLEMKLAGDVNDYVLPHFKRFKTTQDIEALVAEYKWPGNVDLPYLAVFLLLRGNRKGEDVLRRHCREAVHPIYLESIRELAFNFGFDL